MKRRRLVGLLLALLMVSSAPGAAQPKEGAAGSRLDVLRSDGQGIELELVVDGFQVETFWHTGQAYHRLSIPDTVQAEAPDRPQVPVRGALIGLPSERGVRLQLLDAAYETLWGYRLAPAPRPVIIADRIEQITAAELEQPIVLDQLTGNAFSPEHPVELGPVGRLRDQPVAQVRFFPIQYNPASGELRLYRRIRVRISWDVPAGLSLAQSREVSPEYERLLRSTLMNYADLARPAGLGPVITSSLTAGAEAPTQSSRPPLKIGVTADGLYRLSYDALSGAGFRLQGVDPRTLRISNRGAEIPIFIAGEADGVFDPADSILFYGTAIDDIYTAKNIYWLSIGEDAGRRMRTRDGTPDASTPPPAHFPATLHAEEDSYYWQTMPNGTGQDHWFWGDKLTAPATQVYTLTLNHRSPSAPEATIRVRLHGHTDDLSVTPDHHTQIFLNDTLIDDQHWNGQTIYEHEVSAPHSLLRAGDNVVRVTSVGDSGAVVDQLFVNSIAIDYWDTYVAEDDMLLFGAPEAGRLPFAVSGFSSSAVEVYEITDPDDPVRILSSAVADATLRFTDDAPQGARYLALTPARHRTPASLELERASSLHSKANGADYIIITARLFYTRTQRLAEHRRAAGLRVATVRVDDIYDEFNHGIFNPQAIRDFLAYAYQQWSGPAPTYVLLVGDATLDYKDNLKSGGVDYVPSQIFESDLLGQTASDNWFVQVSGADPLPDMFIGRLSAQGINQMDNIVDKIIGYEQQPPDAAWNTRALLVADDDDPSFEALSERLAARLPFYYTPVRLYASDYPPGNPTADIASQIDRGSALVNYAGHGSVAIWGQWHGEVMLHVDDVKQLSNAGRLPVVTIGDCVSGYFTGGRFQSSIAEVFQQHKDGGAVAVWAPTDKGYNAQHSVLLEAFYRAIFQDNLDALGAATTTAKLAAYTHGSFWTSVVETFVLFGDPATRLAIPPNYPYIVRTTPANGASAVPVDQPIQIAFSKPMDPATVALSGATSGGQALTPTWNADQTVLTYRHAGFAYGATITLSLVGQDKVGNPLGPGPVPTTWSFHTPASAGGETVAIAGPSVGTIGESFSFTAVVSPTTVAQPIVYTWQATHQEPQTHTGGLQDTATFRWDTAGTWLVTVTTRIGNKSVADSHSITIAAALPPDLVIYLPALVSVSSERTQ